MCSLKVKQVSFAYDKKIVLENISFSVACGEILGLIGPNGSGKSTLIKGISRVILPFTGEIFINGKNFKDLSRVELARLVSVVPQNPQLPLMFTAFELVLLGRTPFLKYFGVESKEDIEVVYQAMKLTNTEDFINRRIGELSGGERQRVILAKALAQEPKILLLDEPTANLDIGYQIEILNLIKTLALNKRLIVIIAIHDLNLASQFCDRLILLYKRRIYTQGTPKEVINPKNIKKIYKTEDVYVFPHPMNNLPTTIITPNYKHQ